MLFIQCCGFGARAVRAHEKWEREGAQGFRMGPMRSTSIVGPRPMWIAFSRVLSSSSAC